MKFSFLIFFCIFCSIHTNTTAQIQNSFTEKEVYKSESLVIIQIAPNSYQHISYLQTNDFGNVPCNGLVICNDHESIVFDTPTNDKSVEELIKWINKELASSIIAVIPTHFHDDCLGGLNMFNKNGIPSYGNFKTIELAKKNGVTVPEYGFHEKKKLKVGNQHVIVKYPGEGHTPDNVVAYYKKDRVLFGGCLIKEMGATKGFLGDANVKEWSATVEKVKKMFPKTQIVVPGHGNSGNQKQLDYTIELFKADY